MAADQRHEHAGIPLLLFEPTADAVYDGEVLVPGGADRKDEPAVDGELLFQGFWNGRRSSRNKDPIERRGVRQAFGSVADADVHIVQPQTREHLSRRIRQFLVTFDGNDLFHQSREDGGLVSGASSNLEDPMVWFGTK